MAATTHYGWEKPTVNADSDTWGTELNAAIDGVDTALYAVSGVAGAALPKVGGTMTGALVHAVGAVGAPGIAWAGDLDTGLYWVGPTARRWSAPGRR